MISKELAKLPPFPYNTGLELRPLPKIPENHNWCFLRPFRNINICPKALISFTNVAHLATSSEIEFCTQTSVKQNSIPVADALGVEQICFDQRNRIPVRISVGTEKVVHNPRGVYSTYPLSDENNLSFPLREKFSAATNFHQY